MDRAVLTLTYLVCQGRADSRVSLQGDGDGEEHTGSGAHMGDAVKRCDQGVHQGGEGRMEVLERHGHGTQDHEDVSNAKGDHQVIENIAQ